MNDSHRYRGLSKAARFLGLNTNTTLLLGVIVLIAAGEETWTRFVPKYLEVIGASAFVVGGYDALKTFLGAVYAYPGGVVVDRWGHRRAFRLFTITSMLGYGLMLVADHWATVLGATFLFLAWTNLSLPATFTLVSKSLPADKHAMGIGIQSLVRRLPVIIGPVVGGVLIDRLGMIEGFRYGLLLSIAMGALALMMQGRIDTGQATAESQTRRNILELVRGSSRSLRLLLLSDILIRFCERIPFAWVVIYAMNEVGATASEVGLLIALEMAAAIACYVPASAMADRYGKEPFVVMTFVMFTLFPLLVAVSHSIGMLAAAFVVRGLKEFGEPARKALILAYATPGAKGQAVGAYYLIRDTVVAPAAFLGAYLWTLSPLVNLAGAALFGLAGTAGYVWVVLGSRRESHRLAG